MTTQYSVELFAKRISELLQNSGKDYQQIAKETQLSPEALTQYVEGKREPELRALLAFAEYFRVSLDYLLGISNDECIHNKKEYSACFAVHGVFYADILIPDGMSHEEAVQYTRNQAEEVISKANFGDIEEVGWDLDYIENDQHNYTYPDDLDDPDGFDDSDEFEDDEDEEDEEDDEFDE